MSKKLCKWSKHKIEKRVKKLVEATNEQRYLCKKCARVANSQKYLCKPNLIRPE